MRPESAYSWGVFDKLAQDNQRFLWGVLEWAASTSIPIIFIKLECFQTF
jgi:hypothetical protein